MRRPRLTATVATCVAVIGVLLTSPFAASAADRPAQISIAYFQQWPAPVQFVQQKKTLDTVLGLQVNWVPFRSGAQMTAALAAGEVQIAYSLGHVPFLVAVNSAIDLSMVGIAVSYPEDDNCVTRDGAGIDRGNAATFAGKRVAMRPGSVSHYRMLKMLTHLGVDPAALKILPVADGGAALRALRQGEVAMACAHGAALREMVTLGTPLLSAAELDRLGLRLFDVIAVENSFLQQHGDIVETFLAVTDAANKRWNRDPGPMHRAIARAAYMDRDSAAKAMRDFRFPPAAEQKSEAWLGGYVPAYSAELAGFFVAHGQLQQSLDDYARVITTRFLP